MWQKRGWINERMTIQHQVRKWGLRVKLIWKVTENTRRRMVNCLEIKEIEEVLDDIKWQYLAPNRHGDARFDIKPHIKEIACCLLDIAKNELLNLTWSDRNLVLACNIVYKLIRFDVFEKEVENLWIKKYNKYTIRKAVNLIQQATHSDVVPLLINSITAEAISCSLLLRGSTNELRVFLLFVEEVIKIMEKELGREELKNL